MLEKYNGEWSFGEAAHLLRRTTYGPRKSTILESISIGLEATIAQLLGPQLEKNPPIHFDFDQDPEAGIGESWINTPVTNTVQGLWSARDRGIFTWYYQNMNTNGIDISEKLNMFWHNHFVVAGAVGPNEKWTYLNLLREFGLGDFRELTKRMTINKAMLKFLNGAKNIADEPNENFARELLELFTIGKGPLAGEGDYTNYTEQDIAAFAKALTGWAPWNDTIEIGFYRDWAHDDSDKQLSHRFDNQVVTGAGDQEYKNVIDIIFQKDEVAFNISRRIYIWFVDYEISDQIESEIIAPMAQLILDNDYVIKPALEALLSSQHFYSTVVRGCMIKNPLDYLFSISNPMGVELPQDPVIRNKTWLRWHWDFVKMDMLFFSAPSVAGWKAYYQTPIFYRDWINSASLGIRKIMVKKFDWVNNDLDESLNGFDFIKFISTLENPIDVNDLIQESCDLLFPRKLSPQHLDFFKESLLDGLPDFEWTVEYEDYLSTPEDEEKKIAVEKKLKKLFRTMFGIPEFQLS